LNRTKCTKYIALEPNTLMHDEIRKIAGTAGFIEADGSLVLLRYGAEDISAIESVIGAHSVDTMISIFALCTVPSPKTTIHNLATTILKPGGVFLWYEHLLSPVRDVQIWQKVLGPIWACLWDGCSLDRRTDLWIDNAATWSVQEMVDLTTNEPPPEESFFFRKAGKYIKAEKCD